MSDNETKKKGKKYDEEYIPSDRLIVYAKVDILKKLTEEGAKIGLTKNKMALKIMAEHYGLEV